MKDLRAFQPDFYHQCGRGLGNEYAVWRDSKYDRREYWKQLLHRWREHLPWLDRSRPSLAARVCAAVWALTLGSRAKAPFPARRNRYEGPASTTAFVRNGAAYARYIRVLTALGDDGTVVDIGCGLGRKTKDLMASLGPDARYTGVDIRQDAVAWCKDQIGSTDARCCFALIEGSNGFYTPGRVRSQTASRLPTIDESVDLVIANSVFTHLLPDTLAAYLSEVGRVLKPGGQLFATFFMLDDEGQFPYSRSGRAGNPYTFPIKGDGYYAEDPASHEHVVAYTRGAIAGHLRAAGLENAHIYPGSWSGRAPYIDFQDIIVADK